MTELPDADYSNNIIVTGGVLAALNVAAGAFPNSADLDAHVVMEDGVVTNAITIQPSFMKSRYRLTVERVPDDE